MVCSGKRIPFIEREPVKFSLEAKSIFNCDIERMHDYTFDFHIYIDYSAYIYGEDK